MAQGFGGFWAGGAVAEPALRRALFAGGGAGFGELMTGWLRELPTGGLVMCHPGEAGDGVEHAAARAAERAICGAAFAEDLAAAGVRLVRRPAVA